MPSTQVAVSKRAGRLGVSAVDAPNRQGAIISGLCENSVAAAAGLHVGDVVVTVNGYMVGGHRDCIEAIDGAADRVAFVLARPTREVLLDKAQGRIGITCTTLYGSGVLVSALEEGSLASRCGLFVGDTLLSVNGVLCESHQEAIELIDAEPVVRLVVHANTREVQISRRHSGGANGVGLTVADRVDGGAGVVVIGLAPGGLSIRHLRLGDTILAVDGVLVSSHSDAIARIDASDDAFALVLGEPADNLSQILSSVHQSSAAPARHDDRPCEPVFTRHVPVGAGPMREINGCSSMAGARF